MELSLPRFLCHIRNRRSFIPKPPFLHSTAAATLSPNKNPTSLKRSGPSYFASPWPRASTSSDETNTSISNHFEKVSINTNVHFERATDEAVNTDSQSGKVHDEAIGAEAQVQVEPDESINAGETFASVSDEVIATEEYSTATPEAAQAQAIELLDGVNLDYGDSFSIVIYGSGVLVALWILSAIVGAIDSIPLFPKVLEIIGLAYTVWFSYRYLIFKKNRDGLSVKIEELKKQIIGSTSD
eukprot:TRINITY_DN2283_c0_g1_i1.p1 TRINITY_DN2283_c0_g1~~TRINITY_DN2283_c0_g1_i1.p1  ORF type:complete len:241 (+),score=52.01 TRINITY_DN2283_c0_g1_i1:196-918(+)